MSQSWNSLLTYIKHELGAPSNKLEISDAEMQDHITTVVLPEYSAYLGENIYYKLTDSMKTTLEGTNYAYKLPIVANGTRISEVNAAYVDNASTGGSIPTTNIPTTPTQAGMSMQSTNSLITAWISRFAVIKSFRFRPPDIIIFTEQLTTMPVLDLDIVHSTPQSIPSDMYHKAFKKQALVSIIDWIISQRSKYQTMQTPFGEVSLNIDFLQTKSDRLRDEFKEVLNDIPPEPLIEFL